MLATQARRGGEARGKVAGGESGCRLPHALEVGGRRLQPEPRGQRRGALRSRNHGAGEVELLDERMGQHAALACVEAGPPRLAARGRARRRVVGQPEDPLRVEAVAAALVGR